MTTLNKPSLSAQFETLVNQYRDLNSQQHSALSELDALSKTLGGIMAKAGPYNTSTRAQAVSRRARIDQLYVAISKRNKELDELHSKIRATYDQMIAPIEPSIRKIFQIFRGLYMSTLRASEPAKDVERAASANFEEVIQMVRTSIFIHSPETKKQLDLAIKSMLPLSNR